jgi:5-formyltetrahydrofolate cyclo-ligase
MSGSVEFALPVVSEHDDGSMEFYPWNVDSQLKQNRYGISEPQKTISIPLAGFDMLLMPLVAYDRNGNRLGMGSGYYDRHLEPLRDAQQPLRVGIAYSLQEVAQLTKNDWDIPLHAVVTESGWIRFDC